MSEYAIVSEEGTLREAPELSRAAQAVIERRAWMTPALEDLTDIEVYEILSKPEVYGALIDEYLKANTIPTEEEIRKLSATVCLLQKIDYMRAYFLEERRKEFKIPARRS